MVQPSESFLVAVESSNLESNLNPTLNPTMNPTSTPQPNITYLIKSESAKSDNEYLYTSGTLVISLSFHSGHLNTHIFPLLRKHIGHIFTPTLALATQMTVYIYSQFKNAPASFPYPLQQLCDSFWLLSLRRRRRRRRHRHTWRPTLMMTNLSITDLTD